MIISEVGIVICLTWVVNCALPKGELIRGCYQRKSVGILKEGDGMSPDHNIKWNPGVEKVQNRLEDRKLLRDFLSKHATLVPDDNDGEDSGYLSTTSKGESRQDFSEFKETSTVPPHTQKMNHESKVYDKKELEMIKKKARRLKMGMNYLYIGDGHFLQLQKEPFDISGWGGMITVLDGLGEDYPKIYQTSRCFCNWNWRSLGDATCGENLLNCAIMCPLTVWLHVVNQQ